MLDETLSPALAATLGPGEFAPTLEIKVNFIAPAKVGRILGTARIVSRGRSICFMEGQLQDDEGNLLATVICCILSAMSMQQRPLTQKQETFVRKVAEGMAASRAYREAGYTATAHAAEVMASKTLRNAEVAARLAELRAEQAKRHEVTIDSLALEFDENRAHALRVDQVGAAVQATAMKAKLFGFMVDRQQVQVEHTLRKPSADENAPAEMSLEAWQTKYGGGPAINGSGSGKTIEHEPERLQRSTDRG